MSRGPELHKRNRRWTSGAASPFVCAVVLAASSVVSASPATAADPGACGGHWVLRMGGSHAVLQGTITDQANLRQRLPELESSIRTVIAMDSTLSPAVAEALIAAIRDGSGITERPIQRDEAVRWMAYQPEPGRIAAIEPACLRLERVYDAFEITVEVPDSAAMAPAPTCAIVATRTCAAEGPAFTVDIRGSTPGAQVTMASGGGAAIRISGPGELWTVEDPGPGELDAVFTVKAQGEPAPARTARAYRFLIPKICGNVAYLGETTGSTIAAAPAPATCEKSVTVEGCAPPAAPAPFVEPVAVVNRCVDGWVARAFLFGYFPMGDDLSRDVVLPGGPAHESFEVDQGFGLGASVERRFGPVLGIEVAAMFGRGDTTFRIDGDGIAGSASHPANFFALTAGPNFHMLGCGGADLYAGPFVGYGGFGDPNYWVSDYRFRATFDRRFLWGGQIGLDLPFSADGPWGFHGGLRYMRLSQDTDGGEIEINPLIVELGLAYRF